MAIDTRLKIVFISRSCLQYAVSLCRTYLMAIDRLLLDLFAHQFCFIFIFSVLVFPTCGRLGQVSGQLLGAL